MGFNQALPRNANFNLKSDEEVFSCDCYWQSYIQPAGNSTEIVTSGILPAGQSAIMWYGQGGPKGYNHVRTFLKTIVKNTNAYTQTSHINFDQPFDGLPTWPATYEEGGLDGGGWITTITGVKPSGVTSVVAQSKKSSSLYLTRTGSIPTIDYTVTASILSSVTGYVYGSYGNLDLQITANNPPAVIRSITTSGTIFNIVLSGKRQADYFKTIACTGTSCNIDAVLTDITASYDLALNQTTYSITTSQKMVNTSSYAFSFTY